MLQPPQNTKIGLFSLDNEDKQNETILAKRRHNDFTLKTSQPNVAVGESI